MLFPVVYETNDTSSNFDFFIYGSYFDTQFGPLIFSKLTTVAAVNFNRILWLTSSLKTFYRATFYWDTVYFLLNSVFEHVCPRLQVILSFNFTVIFSCYCLMSLYEHCLLVLMMAANFSCSFHETVHVPASMCFSLQRNSLSYCFVSYSEHLCCMPYFVAF